ncbi:MAG TPA: hypothetical protein VEC99_08830 [Clostridia bacterium]|nr:hypothetical protein [Clostridia bacterium]
MATDSHDFIDPVEDCPWRSRREIFASLGYTPVPPNELDDQQLRGRLWELVYAAAGRRFFFVNTNHLSDRELYMLLWTQWLDKPTADIPLEAETNTTTIVSEFDANGLTQEEIRLRFYADDSYRELVRSIDPDFVFPPHEDPPYDRDRFLPVPPVPLEAHAGWLPGDDEPAETQDVDPLGLAVDEAIASDKDEETPDAPVLEQPDSAIGTELRAMEPESWTPPVKKLTAENVPLLPPAEITEETLTPILWELLHNLALRGFYVLHTDHLSDLDLYAKLWHHGLREPALMPGRNLRGGWFHDFLGSWGTEEMQLWLKYYATDEQRAKHAAEYPQDTIPPKEKLRYSRDWRLPKGPF